MFFAGQRIGEPHRLERVVGEQDDEDDCDIHEVTMHILDDQREGTFAEKGFARFTDGAVDRVSPECFVISAAIIITGETKSARRPQNQERGRKRKEVRPETGRAVENGVRRIAPDFRRVKRRDVIGASDPVVVSLKRRPRRINDERHEPEKYEERLHPPSIRARRLSKFALRWKGVCVGHKHIKATNP